jgi:peptidoglycan/xylan/chitin deacetylase (PgdA/CDA1 family)
MLRCTAALLALLLALPGLAKAQEQDGTRATPPAGRSLPPPVDATASLAGRNQAPAARSPEVAARRPAAVFDPAVRQAADRLSGALTSAARKAGQPSPASSAPAPAMPLGRFARQATGQAPALAPPAPPRQAVRLMAGLQGVAALPAAPGAGLQAGLMLASRAAPDGLTPAAFTSPVSGPPLDMALPTGPPRMPAATLRSGLFQVVRGNPRQKKVALTFDDGPHPEYTSQLLAILGYYHIHATFFIVGVQAQRYPQWVKMIHQAGHEIGNHTYDHFRLPALPPDEQAYQIDENQRLLEQLTGVTPRFFRPPGGRYNEQAERLIRQRGMLLALWDVALNDTAEDREAGDLYSTASHKIRPGSVVLGHDGIQATIDMLPQLIESLQKDGYTFVTMSELASGI